MSHGDAALDTTNTPTFAGGEGSILAIDAALGNKSGAGLALALPAGIIWILDVLQVVSLRAVLDVTLSWQFLLGSTLVGIVAWRLIRGP